MIRLKEGTHEKIIIKDNEEAAVGSCNWLSHNYYGICRKNSKNLTVRRETSLVVDDPGTIQSLIDRIKS
jgi:phosphatidylserine/phosphatidylglycerophosphate/cardiolipin synthase-like enzyme